MSYPPTQPTGPTHPTTEPPPAGPPRVRAWLALALVVALVLTPIAMGAIQ